MADTSIRSAGMPVDRRRSPLDAVDQFTTHHQRIDDGDRHPPGAVIRTIVRGVDRGPGWHKPPRTPLTVIGNSLGEMFTDACQREDPLGGSRIRTTVPQAKAVQRPMRKTIGLKRGGFMIVVSTTASIRYTAGVSTSCWPAIANELLSSWDPIYFLPKPAGDVCQQAEGRRLMGGVDVRDRILTAANAREEIVAVMLGVGDSQLIGFELDLE